MKLGKAIIVLIGLGMFGSVYATSTMCTVDLTDFNSSAAGWTATVSYWTPDDPTKPAGSGKLSSSAQNYPITKTTASIPVQIPCNSYLTYTTMESPLAGAVQTGQWVAIQCAQNAKTLDYNSSSAWSDWNANRQAQLTACTPS